MALLVRRGKMAYDASFFENNRRNALAAAQIIVPIVLELVRPTSVVDVGCGSGAWLRVFKENGVGVIRGLDGSYVDRSKLLIDEDAFTPIDLGSNLSIPGHYDLAVCLEVAEHLPEKSIYRLIEELTAASPVVLFSAAIPGQGGTGHVSERWPGYWRELFAQRGYRMLDPIRRRIRDDHQVKWWYRQNVVMFASEEAIHNNPTLLAVADQAADLEWVHVDLVRNPKFLVRTIRDVMWERLRSALSGRRQNR
jgi:SAM-dependent methyltransferase